MTIAKAFCTGFVFCIFFVLHANPIRSQNINPQEIVLKTISDKIKEFNYVFKGSLVLQYDIEAHLLSHILDLQREKLDHPDTDDALEIDNILSSFEKTREHFDRVYSNNFPPVNEEGEAIPGALKYWVGQQLKYSKKPFEHNFKYLRITLDRVEFEEVRVDPINRNVSASYTAHVRGIKDISGGSTESSLEVGETFFLPESTHGTYYQTMGEEFLKFYSDGMVTLKKPGPDSFEDLKQKGLVLLEKTKNNDINNCYYVPDGDALSPYNYFYYFDCSLCTEVNVAYTKLTVIKAEEREPDYSIYPEYHRLFEDGQADIFIYFNEVGNEAPHKSRQLRNSLKSIGFKEESPCGGYYRLSKKLQTVESPREISFNVRIVVAENVPGGAPMGAVELYSEAIKQDEVIMYDGHSGYGGHAKVYNNFENFPEKKYQIFFFNSCSAYEYMLSDIISNKVIRDFDFLNHNIDVIATYSSSYMSATNKFDLIQRLLMASQYYNSGTLWQTKNLEKKLSWLSIITAINAMDYADALYLVTAEENNTFMPGLTTVSPIGSDITMNKIMEIFKSNKYPKRIRVKALSRYLILLANEEKDFEALKMKAEDLCREILAPGMEEILNYYFYIPSCQIYNISVGDNSYEINGIVFRDYIRFYKYYRLKGGILVKPTMVNGYECKNEISFHLNGQIENCNLTKKTKIGDFYFSKTLSFYKNGKLFYGGLYEPVKVNNILFEKILVFSHEGIFLGGQLVEATRINNIYFMNFVTFHSNGVLSSGELFRDTTIDGMSFSGQIQFHDNGMVSWGVLNHATIINGIKLYGLITFHKNGMVATGVLKDDVTLNGYMFSGEITFHENGKIESGNLKDAVNINGLEYNGAIRFDSDGNFVSGYISGSVTENGISYYGDVSFFKNGNLSCGSLEERTVIQGIHCEADQKVEYFESGKLKAATLAEPAQINGLLLESEVRFYEDGSLNAGSLSEDTRIGGVLYKGSIVFHKNGFVSWGTLAKEVTLEGKTYYYHISLDENGKVVSGE